MVNGGVCLKRPELKVWSATKTAKVHCPLVWNIPGSRRASLVRCCAAYARKKRVAEDERVLKVEETTRQGKPQTNPNLFSSSTYRHGTASGSLQRIMLLSDNRRRLDR